ncbi:unnamed protein product [Arctogadus glacialis]
MRPSPQSSIKLSHSLSPWSTPSRENWQQVARQMATNRRRRTERLLPASRLPVGPDQPRLHPAVVGSACCEVAPPAARLPQNASEKTKTHTRPRLKMERGAECPCEVRGAAACTGHGGTDGERGPFFGTAGSQSERGTLQRLWFRPAFCPAPPIEDTKWVWWQPNNAPSVFLIAAPQSDRLAALCASVGQPLSSQATELSTAAATAADAAAAAACVFAVAGTPD